MEDLLLLLRRALLLLMIAGVPSTALAYDITQGGIYYNLSDNGATVTYKDANYNSYSGDVTIPESITSGGKTYKILTIGLNAFRNCTGLTSVKLPNTVQYFSNTAFYNCTSLTTISIPSSVYTIYNNVFDGCTGLTSVTCNWTTARQCNTNNFPSSVYTQATLYVPKGSSSSYSSTGCWSSFSTIKEMNYDFEVDGIYYIKTSSNTAEVTYRDDRYNSYSGKVTVPSTVKYDNITYKVTSIGFGAFYYSTGLTEVVVGQNVTSIGDWAFQDCINLEKVTLPSGLKSLGEGAFYYCTALKSATIPGNCTTIGNQVFYGCYNLESVTLGNGVTEVTELMFYDCTNLKSVTLPNTLQYIDQNGFRKCYALEDIKLPSSLLGIDYEGFRGCTALKSIVIPNSVTYVAKSAFYATGLESVVLGSGLTYIGKSAFASNSAINTIISLATAPPQMESKGCFNTADYSTATLMVPQAALDSYQTTSWWNEFETIKATSFDFCVDGIYYKKLTSSTVAVTYRDTNFNSYSGTVNIPATIKVDGVTYIVREIGIQAFWKSSGLTTVTMPSSVTKICEYAFCSAGLTEVTIGSGVKSIEGMAFNSCTSLTTVTFPEGLTTISYQAFHYCPSLTSIVIPNTVTTIKSMAFYQCSALKTLSLGSGLESLTGQQVFGKCDALTTVTSYAKVPPTMDNSNCFSSAAYASAVLYVPKSSLNSYKSADWWRMFTNIKGADIGGEPCDVNGDGEINIADINACIDAILNGNSSADFDANGDGEINIADVNYIIATILSK